MPMIDIVIPIFNVAPVLGRCLCSLLYQNFTEYSLLLIDDGSADESSLISDLTSLINPKFKSIHNRNSGVSSARNIGIEMISSPFFMFVDSDDYVNKDFIETFIENKSDLTISSYNTYSESGQIIVTSRYIYNHYKEKFDIDFLYLSNKLFSPYCKLFTTSIIKKHGLSFPCDYSWGEDAVFVSDYVRHVSNVIVLPYNGYNYVKYNSNSTLSTKIRYDIIDTITSSRQIYLNNILAASSRNHNEIKQNITDETKHCCSIFLTRLFKSNLTIREKKRFYRHFISNNNVIKIIEHENYFIEDSTIKRSLSLDIDKTFQRYLILKLESKVMHLMRLFFKPFPKALKKYIRRKLNFLI